MQQRLSGIEGIQSVTFNGSRGYFGVGRGEEKPVPTFATGAYSLEVGNRFFETMGIRILGGPIDERDHSAGPRTVVVNREFARHFFPGENPLGKSFRNASEQMLLTIIGVAGDARYTDLRKPIPPTAYVPMRQQDGNGALKGRNAGTLMVRINGAWLVAEPAGGVKPLTFK